MRLTNEELLNLNNIMLGLGAPIELDSQGYNQVDFSNMRRYMYNSTLTDSEAYRVAQALFKYKNTQLNTYADRLQETVNELKPDTSLPQKKAVTIQVLGNDYSEVRFTWEYHQGISKAIQNLDRRKFKWTRNGSTWVFNISWSNLDLVYPIFDTYKVDTSELKTLKETVMEESLKALQTSKELIVTVLRLDDSFDTLVLTIPQHPVIEQVLNTVQDIKFLKESNTWVFYIEQSAEIYDKLSKAGKAIDLTELKPWRDMVKSWDKQYKSKDFSHIQMKFQPYLFQLEDVDNMLKAGRIINGNDMGCGKTHESVRVGESLPMKKLVICPATLRLNWVNEIKIVNPDADIKVLYDASDFEVGADWTVIGYPSVSKHLKSLEQERFQCIFIDEAHYCQAIANSGKPDSQRAFAVLRLTATAGWVYPITGTPKTNRNKNLFNILKMVKHPLTRGDWAFHNYGVTYCDGQNNGWGWDYNGNSNDSELHEQLKPYMIRHLKSEVLPDLKKQRIAVPVSVDLREYDEIITEYLNSRTNKEAEQLARLMRARKVLATQKVGETIDFAKEIVADGDKVVLVTCFTDVAQILEKTFKNNCVKIVGGMSDAAKESAKDEFQNGKVQVMILNIIAGGVGITLTAAYKMIINDVDFVPGNEIQVEDRICRGGQTAELCFIYYMVALGADVEEDFIDMLTYKSETINQVIDGGNGDSIDFRSLVNKSAGITRKNKVRRVLASETDDKGMPAHPSKIKTDKSSIDWKHYSIEDLERMSKEYEITITKYDNPGIYRMRLIMSLKKAL